MKSSDDAMSFKHLLRNCFFQMRNFSQLTTVLSKDDNPCVGVIVIRLLHQPVQMFKPEGAGLPVGPSELCCDDKH